jgi:hypothetical protein
MKKIYLMTLVCAISIMAINAQTVIFSEDFEAGTTIPTGWTQTTIATDGGWLFGDATAMGSQYFTIPDHTKFACTNEDACNCDKSNDFLMSPSFSTSSSTALVLKFDYFYYDALYSGAQEVATVRYSIDNGTTWTDLTTLGASNWGTFMADFSVAAGNSSVMLGFHYNDGGGWTYGMCIDDVEVYEPLAYDASILSLNMQEYVATGSYDVQGAFFNYGASQVTALDVNYSVDGGTPVSYTMTGLTVDPLNMDAYMHNTPISFTTAGVYEVVVWLSNPNGMPDLNTSNDSITFTVTVLDQVATKKVLVEHHTQASCAPCASQNPALDQLITSTQNIDKVAHIAYHTSWPGTDPMYDFNLANGEDDARTDYYGVNGVPNCVVSGNQADGLPSVVTQDLIDSESAKAGLFDVSGSAYMINNTLNIEVDLEALTGFPEGTLQAHVVLVEEVNYTAAPGSNGETYFPDVMRRMFPSPDGANIGNPAEGDVIPLDYTYDIQSPVDTNMCHLVVFVQNNVDKAIYMATTMDIDLSTSIEHVENMDVKVYPNPTSGVFNVANVANSEVTVYNVLGEVIESTYTADFSTSIDLSSQPEGTYLIQVRNNDKVYTEKVVLTR